MQLVETQRILRAWNERMFAHLKRDQEAQRGRI
jgi:hypothetical protein